MSFRELLEKYKNNTASEEERIIVEEEIEKYQAINDYTAENMDINFNQSMNEKNFEEVKQIRKAVRKSNTALVSTAVGIIILLIVLFNFIGIPLINSIYYNPEKCTYSDHMSDLGVEFSTFTELHIPAMVFNSISIESVGIGKYSAVIQQQNSFTRKYEDFYSTIDKGKLNINKDFFAGQIVNACAYAAYPYNPQDKKTINSVLKIIKGLPKSSLVKAYISFNKDLSMKEFVKIYDRKSTDLYASWVCIRNAPANYLEQRNQGMDIQRLPLIGFESEGHGIVMDEINKFYTNYEICDQLLKNKNMRATIYEKHFKELIKFQLDNQNLLKVINKDFDSKRYYTDVLHYINKYGVKTYGMVVIGTPESIIKLSKEKVFCGIFIDDAKLY